MEIREIQHTYPVFATGVYGICVHFDMKFEAGHTQIDSYLPALYGCTETVLKDLPAIHCCDEVSCALMQRDCLGWKQFPKPRFGCIEVGLVAHTPALMYTEPMAC